MYVGQTCQLILPALILLNSITKIVFPENVEILDKIGMWVVLVSFIHTHGSWFIGHESCSIILFTVSGAC